MTRAFESIYERVAKAREDEPRDLGRDLLDAEVDVLRAIRVVLRRHSVGAEQGGHQIDRLRRRECPMARNILISSETVKP